MTTDELAAILLQHPGLLVAIDGYECSINQEIMVGTTKVELARNAEGHGDDCDTYSIEICHISAVMVKEQS